MSVEAVAAQILADAVPRPDARHCDRCGTLVTPRRMHGPHSSMAWVLPLTLHHGFLLCSTCLWLDG